MRQKIEASRATHSEAESRLENLHKNVATLTERLDIMISGSSDTPTPLITSLQPEKSFKSTSGIIMFTKLSVDSVALIFSFSTFPEVYRLRSLSREIARMVEESPYWLTTGRLRIPFLFDNLKSRTAPYSTCMHVIINYVKDSNLSVYFLEQMKEQRLSQRHDSIQPKRYLRSERTVTHPLPLLHHRDHIMSQCESFDSNFRTLAHIALESMVYVTSSYLQAIYTGSAPTLMDMDINSLIRRLLDEDIVTVMTSLLSNEEATLKNYACAILANLLCWEALQLKRNGSSTIHDDKYSVIKMIEACSTQRLLANLLTSPSASISLMKNTTGLSSKSSSASRVQGVCNKNSARALILLFYSENPVIVIEARQYFDDVIKQEDSPLETRVDHSPTISPVIKTLKSSASERIFSTQTSQNWRQPRRKSSLPSDYSFIHTVTPTATTASKSWQFTYFYKSGAFKDHFICQLTFSTDYSEVRDSCALHGSGKDTIGQFTLEGEVDTDIVGQSVYFSKTYQSHALDSGGVVHDHESSRQNRAKGAHVVHIGFFSEEINKITPEAMDAASSSTFPASFPAIIEKEQWSKGLWGVWELCNSQSHFELMKGGVFRAIPLT